MALNRYTTNKWTSRRMPSTDCWPCVIWVPFGIKEFTFTWVFVLEYIVIFKVTLLYTLILYGTYFIFILEG